MNTTVAKAGQLYKYGVAAWCRHGLVLLHDEGYGLSANDTYWGSGESGRHPVDEVVEKGQLIADLNQFRVVHREECERYADPDTVFIPLGGRSPQYWVRKDAEPNRERVLAQLEEKIRSAESKIRMAERDIELAKGEQAKWEQGSLIAG